MRNIIMLKVNDTYSISGIIMSKNKHISPTLSKVL
jgi:hypothetical protein